MNNNELNEIFATQVTVEVVDKKTGKLFRRTLPITYIENYNGLKLSGENLKGELSEIVFFSETGIAKLKDLSGKGPDISPCHGHDDTHL